MSDISELFKMTPEQEKRYKLQDILFDMFIKSKDKHEVKESEWEICVGRRDSGDYYSPPEEVYVPSTLMKFYFDLDVNVVDFLTDKQKERKEELIIGLQNYFNENIVNKTHRLKLPYMTMNSDLVTLIEDVIEENNYFDTSLSDEYVSEYKNRVVDFSLTNDGLLKFKGEYSINFIYSWD